jgi:transketolase
LDEEILIEAAGKTRGIITVEEHSMIGGLGEAVSSCLSQVKPTFVRRIGMNDVFGESGQAQELMDKFGLRAANIVKEAMTILKEKKR